MSDRSLTDPTRSVARTARRSAADAATASPLQREFARLSRQVAQAQQRLQAWRAVPDALDSRVHGELAPAMAAQREAEHTLAIQLDALLVSPPKGVRLGATRREALTAYLLELCRGLLADGGDDTLAAIHDRHSAHSFAALEEEGREALVEQTIAMLDEALGEGAVRPLPGESDDAFLARAQRHLQQAYEAERAREDAARARRAQRRAERKAARDATRAKAAGARRGEARGHASAAQAGMRSGGGPAAHAGDPAGEGSPSADEPTEPSAAPSPPGQPADTAPEDRLRALYRRLASALHPDRASEGDARIRRTQQMKALNAAWEARDLPALLAIQADALPGDGAPATLPDDQARDYIALLKAQLERLKADTRRAADTATPPDIAIARGRPRDPRELMLWLDMDLQRMQRNTRILRAIAAGLADPGQRMHVITELVDIAEAELARRAVAQFVHDMTEPW